MRSLRQLSPQARTGIILGMCVLLVAGTYVVYIQEVVAPTSQERESTPEQAIRDSVAAFSVTMRADPSNANLERLEIVSIKKITTTSYVVEAVAHERAAVELPQGGKSTYPVVITLSQKGGVWVVTDLQKIAPPTRE